VSSNTVLSVNQTAGAGITVSSPTGNVVVTANISRVQVQSSTLGIGIGSNTASYASLTTSSQVLQIDIPNNLYNIGNITLTGNLSSNNVTVSNTLNALGNITANYFYGNGNNISNIDGLNIIGADGNSSNVLYANGVFATSGNTGNITFSNTTIGTAQTLDNVIIQTHDTSNSVISNWVFDSAGNLTLPTSGVITNAYASSGGLVSTFFGDANGAAFGTGTINNITITGANARIYANNHLWQFGDANLTLPDAGIIWNNGGLTTLQAGTDGAQIGSNDGQSYVIANANGTYMQTLADTTNSLWHFGTDGNLTLSDFGIIWNNGGLTTLQAGTDGAQIGSNDGQSYVIANANGTYMQTLADTTNSLWHFGTDGNLTTPANIIVDYTGNVSNANVITANYFVGDGSNLSNVPITWTTAPISNTASGAEGQVAYDAAGNLYVCVATNAWSKILGSTSW